MKNILKISSAMIGAVMGAGFASGQEVMQYFTSFGIKGIWGTLFLAVAFGIASLMMISIGHKLKAVSHIEVIRKLCGRYLGFGYDIVIIFTLFGIGVVMIAGSGPALSEQFDAIPTYVGSIMMAATVLITIMFGVKNVIKVLAILTPLFLLIIIFVNIYGIINGSSATNLESLATQQPSITNHWFTSAFNNLSLLIIINAAILFIMGGSETNGKQAIIGGLIGGVGCGILFLLSNVALYKNIDLVGMLEMPTLGLAGSIHPAMGYIYSVALFGMIYSTAVSVLFSMSARFYTPKTTGFRIFSLISVVLATSLSFYGFSNLVSVVFPAIGYAGYVFIGVLIIGYFRVVTAHRKNNEKFKLNSSLAVRSE